MVSRCLLSNRLTAPSARYGVGIVVKRQWSRRLFSAQAVSEPSNLVQVYISRSTDPYLNLSVEHFLLQKSRPQSVVLFLYTNRPCIVIGRNQNPWVEVNLGLVNQPGILERLRTQRDGERVVGNAAPGPRELDVGGSGDDGDILLVRRRSGGGTVFHDVGNVNYSVICPPSMFDRDNHAEMVARALRSLGVPYGVRVNERHDIVLDVSSSATAANPNQKSPPPAQTGMEESRTQGVAKTFKISGSAYKLTRSRSLHHGTCLLSSPHLPLLSRLLRSPAAPFIKARGVESVRSPVRNVGVSNTDFEEAVVSEFRKMYEHYEPETPSATQQQTNLPDVPPEDRHQAPRNEISVETIADAEVRLIPEICAGVTELSSPDWIYAQTPQFVFSSHPTADDPRPRPSLPDGLPSYFFPPSDSSKSVTHGAATAPGLQMIVRHAEVTDVIAPGSRTLADPQCGLKGLHLHRVKDWRVSVGDEVSVGEWLNVLLGLGSQSVAHREPSSVPGRCD
ncbi:hypothetical protein F5Y17DRAFT_13057 [Xylariaceae sp. FL0594]|nr:hypothetical protein F5Y17DRAFT_13057 [Xylariaceae sp. FL0594]